MYLGNKRNNSGNHQILGNKRTGTNHFFGNKKAPIKKSTQQPSDNEQKEHQSDLERRH